MLSQGLQLRLISPGTVSGHRLECSVEEWWLLAVPPGSMAQGLAFTHCPGPSEAAVAVDLLAAYAAATLREGWYQIAADVLARLLEAAEKLPGVRLSL